MLTIPPGPLAWSLPGGGARGCDTVGRINALWHLRPGIMRHTRVVYGTSTGALIAAKMAAALVTKDKKHVVDLMKIYMSVKDGDILGGTTIGGLAATLGFRALMGGESIYSTEPLAELIDRFMPDLLWKEVIHAGTRKHSPIEVGFVTVNMQSGKLEVFTNRSHPDPAILKKAVLASATQPVFTNLVDINGKEYADGGLVDINPVGRLFEADLINDVNGIIAFSLHAKDEPTEPKSYRDIIGALIRTLDILTATILEDDVKGAHLINALLKARDSAPKSAWDDVIEAMPKELRDVILNKLQSKRYIPILHLRPKEPIIMEGLEFKQPAMRNQLRKAYQEVKQSLK